MTPKKRKQSRRVSLSQIHAAGLKAQRRAAAGATDEDPSIRQVLATHHKGMMRVFRQALKLIGKNTEALELARTELQQSEHRRERIQRAPYGFGQGELEPGERKTFNPSAPKRPFIPDRLLIVASAPGLVIESLHIGDDELLLPDSGGVPVELFGTNALSDAVPERYPTITATDQAPRITLHNTSASRISVSIGMKGRLETDSETIVRQEFIIQQLRQQLASYGDATAYTAASDDVVYAGGINGASEPPPPLPDELSEGELAEVKRSVAPLADRPLVIPGQE